MKHIIIIILTSWLLIGCLNKANINNSNTEMQVINEFKDSVLMYVTLGGGHDSTFIQNVNGIFNCKQIGLNGIVWVQPNETLTYVSTKCFSGNISFGVAPMNCSTTAWKTGMNIFEFNLNEPQESIDISCIAGVNCILRCDLIGGPDWEATPLYPNPRILQNDSMYKNTNRVGVYPYGCTNCVNTEGKQTCQVPSETPNAQHICNPTRAKGDRGGIVRVTFKGYTNLEIND
jgi:hypothetical protein